MKQCFFRLLAALLLIIGITLPVCGMADELTPSVITPQHDEAAVYARFLLEGGYSKILRSVYADSDPVVDESTLADFNLSACLIDLNRDGICEALIQLENIEYGFPCYYGLLTMEDDNAKLLTTASHEGGSIGGSHLQLCRNVITQEYVVIKSDLVRGGWEMSGYTCTVYINDQTFTAYTLTEDYYNISTWAAEYADAVREETDIYTLDGDDFYCRTLNGTYIPADVFNTLYGALTAPSDEFTLFFPGSYSEPITGFAFTNLSID